MKNITLALFFLLVSIISYAQEKRDYIWLLGANPNKPEQFFGGSMIDFNQNPPEISYFDISIDFFAIAMISDTYGKLQFYTNGCDIINKNNVLMANGNNLNPGLYHNIYCGNDANIGYPLSQGVLALPIPGHVDKYILFHFRHEDTGEKKNLLYSIINMDTPDSLGLVESKNQMLLADYLGDMLTAVRHGNGRDWWIVAPKTSSQDGYLFLLTPQGIEGPITRQLGQYWSYDGATGQAVFSPDGTKYARMNKTNGLHLAHFDRCSGTFSNAIKIDFPGDTISSAGAAFSPNSRFLYVSVTDKVYQFDTWAGNIKATEKTVAVYDGFTSPLPTTFFQQMLAPDGKIYITSGGDNNVLHVILNPDQSGLACNLEQHGIILPTKHFAMTPNFPHFRLYDLAGSVCDTLGINDPSVAVTEPGDHSDIVMTLSPNPASETLTVYLNDSEGQLELCDITGNVWLAHKKAAGEKQVSFRTVSLPAGFYVVSFRAISGRQTSRKLVIRH